VNQRTAKLLRKVAATHPSIRLDDLVSRWETSTGPERARARDNMRRYLEAVQTRNAEMEFRRYWRQAVVGARFPAPVEVETRHSKSTDDTHDTGATGVGS
jgi:hypothetical protein